MAALRLQIIPDTTQDHEVYINYLQKYINKFYNY
jgi:hypothetical protein